MMRFLDMSEKEVKEILEKAEAQKRQDIDTEAAKIFEDTGKEENLTTARGVFPFCGSVKIWAAFWL